MKHGEEVLLAISSGNVGANDGEGDIYDGKLKRWGDRHILVSVKLGEDTTAIT